MSSNFPNSGTVLFVEDIMDEANPIVRFLRSEGLSVDYVSTVESALLYLKKRSYDVVVLDVLMESGIEQALRRIFDDGTQEILLTPERHSGQSYHIAKWLRENQPEVGVIMLTGRFTEEEHALLGLEAGADDYIMKGKLRLKEFSTRVRTLIRRCQPFSQVRAHTPLFDLLVKPQKIVSPSGQSEYLTDAEFMVLRRLMLEPDKVLSRKALLQSTNLRASDANGLRAADTLVKNLREKLARCGVDETVIRTRRGKGYMLDGTANASVVE